MLQDSTVQSITGSITALVDQSVVQGTISVKHSIQLDKSLVHGNVIIDKPIKVVIKDSTIIGKLECTTTKLALVGVTVGEVRLKLPLGMPPYTPQKLHTTSCNFGRVVYEGSKVN